MRSLKPIDFIPNDLKCGLRNMAKKGCRSHYFCRHCGAFSNAAECKLLKMRTNGAQPSTKAGGADA